MNVALILSHLFEKRAWHWQQRLLLMHNDGQSQISNQRIPMLSGFLEFRHNGGLSKEKFFDGVVSSFTTVTTFFSRTCVMCHCAATLCAKVLCATDEQCELAMSFADSCSADCCRCERTDATRATDYDAELHSVSGWTGIGDHRCVSC